MNFQQLRVIRESVQRNFNLTEVANALYTSQSGVSKHIKGLEDELDIELFVRRGKRLLGQFSNIEQGQLTIDTTHTQARYALRQVVRRFKAADPLVHLGLY